MTGMDLGDVPAWIAIAVTFVFSLLAWLRSGRALKHQEVLARAAAADEARKQREEDRRRFDWRILPVSQSKFETTNSVELRNSHSVELWNKGIDPAYGVRLTWGERVVTFGDDKIAEFPAGHHELYEVLVVYAKPEDRHVEVMWHRRPDLRDEPGQERLRIPRPV